MLERDLQGLGPLNHSRPHPGHREILQLGSRPTPNDSPAPRAHGGPPRAPAVRGGGSVCRGGASLGAGWFPCLQAPGSQRGRRLSPLCIADHPEQPSAHGGGQRLSPLCIAEHPARASAHGGVQRLSPLCIAEHPERASAHGGSQCLSPLCAAGRTQCNSAGVRRCDSRGCGQYARPSLYRYAPRTPRRSAPGARKNLAIHLPDFPQARPLLDRSIFRSAAADPRPGRRGARD
jgi:hypothetical protein